MKTLIRLGRHAAAVLVLAATTGTPGAAMAAPAEPLSFEAAWQQVQARSARLAGAEAATRARQLQRQGIERLGGPTVAVSGAAAAYHAALNIDLSGVNGAVQGAVAALPIPLQNLPIPVTLPSLPPSYTYSRDGRLATGSVTALAPIYLGGATDALRGLADAETGEARADARQTRDELATLLAQRYFGAQLAERAARLREQALVDVAGHDAAAEKLLQQGTVSRLERLQARAAYEDARRQAAKARSDADLAAQALARLVQAEGLVQPTTPLFAQREPLAPLATWVAQALARHPGLEKVAAKRQQAERLHEAGEAGRRPQVFAFAQRDLRRGEQANWVAGLGARWTLFDTLDREALSGASAARIAQAEAAGEQARSDIVLLVERQWRAVEQARVQLLALEASLDLADELVRLRAAGLREGTGTAQERMDAEVNRAKVRTEQAQAAHDYVVALAGLLQACGTPEALAEHIARADIRIE